MSKPTREDYRRDIRTILTFGVVVTAWMVVAEFLQVVGTRLVGHSHLFWGIPFMAVSYAMLLMLMGWCGWAMWKLTRGRTNVQDR